MHLVLIFYLLVIEVTVPYSRMRLPPVWRLMVVMRVPVFPALISGNGTFSLRGETLASAVVIPLWDLG